MSIAKRTRQLRKCAAHREIFRDGHFIHAARQVLLVCIADQILFGDNFHGNIMHSCLAVAGHELPY
jgi:hypothetical protein